MMSTLRNLALLFLTALSSLSAMAQYTTLSYDRPSYLNQASSMPAYMPQQMGMLPQASHRQYRKRGRMDAVEMQSVQQPTTYVGGTTITGSTMVGSSTIGSTGNTTISPTFTIKYGMPTQLGAGTTFASTATMAGQPTQGAQSTGNSVADTARIQADEQIRAANEINSKTRKCSGVSTGLGLVGTVFGSMFGAPAVGATIGGALGGALCK